MLRCLKITERSCIWSLLIPNCGLLQAEKRTLTRLQYHASSIKLRNIEDQVNCPKTRATEHHKHQLYENI